MLTLSIYMSLLMPGAETAPPPSFEDLLEQCYTELHEKQEKNIKAWGMDKIDKWSWDDHGNLNFVLKDGSRVTARFQVLGSYNSKNESFIWAWDNPKVKPELAYDADKMRHYGEKHSIGLLKSPGWKGESLLAWKLAAFAMHECEASGVWSAPVSDELHVFLLFREVKVLPPGQ